MASESSTPSWVVPALLIAAAVFVGVVGWLVWNASSDGAEDEGLIPRLEAYTSCLSDEGANVPVIEARGDGGFAIVVPGALLDHDVDVQRFFKAAQACRDLAPDAIATLFGSGDLDLGPLLGLLGQAGAFDPGARVDPARGAELRRLCEQVARGGIDDPVAVRRLEALCDQLSR